MDLLRAYLAREASVQAQADMEYFRDNEMVPTPALLEELATRRAHLASGRLMAELEQRMSAGVTPEQAVTDYLTTLEEDDPVVQPTEVQHPTDHHEETTHMTQTRKGPTFMSRQYARVTRARRFMQQSNPIPKILVGLLLLLFFLIGSVIHIMTSEAFYLGDRAVGLLSANWQILLQPAQLAIGTLPGGMEMQKAVIWGWGVELVFLICIIGYDKLHRSVRSSSRLMAKIFRVGTFIIIFFDGWSDFNYGGTGETWGQLGFTAITAFAVFYFGTGGFHLVSEGLTELAEGLREEDEYDDL
jgi:hypothetical protein